MKAKVGDWVSAETSLNFVYIGFVYEKLNTGMFNVYIPKHNIYMPFDVTQLAVCPVYYTEEELDDVIDLALLLKDELWFKELIKEKEAIKWPG